ncbi:MAG: MmcQ/YjbR family DNA-binding protein [Clostridiales bacterium]|nr:MmcQ/YjbR family DNA-binding protein [Clostridiales bacterium]
MTVKIDESGEVETELFDLETEEIYTLHLVAEASGEFVGKVRSEHDRVLEEICEKCFESSILGGQFTKKVIEYVQKRYGDELEFLWERYPDAAIIRRKDNRKWYALFMTVSKKKLGLDDDEPAEIIDLRFDKDELPKIVDGKRYFFGYHMNKKHWITVLLDGSVPIEEILNYLDNSYKLAK